jgi:hypothetical protein
MVGTDLATGKIDTDSHYHGCEHDYDPVCDTEPKCVPAPAPVSPAYHTDTIRCYDSQESCQRWHTTATPPSDGSYTWPGGTEWTTPTGKRISPTKGKDDEPVVAAPPGPEDNQSPRASALNEARDLITGDRNAQYGPPTQDFARTADLLNALGYTRVDAEAKAHPILASDVAIIIAQVKVSRLMHSRGKRDSWVDLAGYAACGYECATEEENA